MTTEEMQNIGEAHGLRVIEMDEDELAHINMDRSSFVDRSWIAGSEMRIGFYTDQEKRTVSFFHEVGHCLARHPEYHVDTEGRCFKVAPELVAWMIGLREAAKHGVHFSAETIDWALSQAISYRNYG